MCVNKTIGFNKRKTYMYMLEVIELHHTKTCSLEKFLLLFFSFSSKVGLVGGPYSRQLNWSVLSMHLSFW